MRLFLLVLVLSSFLSVDNSATIPNSFTSKILKTLDKAGKAGKSPATGDVLQNITTSLLIRALNPPAPSLPPIKIKGLAIIKQYLYTFGFIENRSSSRTDYFDATVRSALIEYQKFFNLKVTGWIDKSTLQQMSLPRCGVPDIFYSQMSTSQNLSWPNGKWLLGRKNITYGFHPRSEIPTNMTSVIEEAFKRWSDAMAMNFTETAFSAADIKIGFYLFDDLFNDTMVGDVTLELVGQDNVRVGAIRLDAGKYWVLPVVNDSFTWPTEAVDLETVVMHHIGHLVGLGHLSAEEAVMYPYILPSRERKVQLSNADKQSIRKLNASSGESERNASSGERERNAITAVLSSLSVGLASMILLI